MFDAERHRRLAGLLDVRSASRVVDLGCGRGETLIEVARELGPDGELIGIDARARAAPDALAGDSRLSLLVADLAEPLPFEDGRFDRAVCHNVLECLEDHQAFLAEAWRVLAADGLFVVGHSDFDTIVFTSDDLALTRRLVHRYCDTTQRWMRQSEGTIGRRLPGIVAGSRFAVGGIHAWVNVVTSFDPGSPGHEAAHAVAEIGRRDPTIDGRAIDDWLRGLERLAAAGAFLYSVNDYAVVGRKTRDG